MQKKIKQTKRGQRKVLGQKKGLGQLRRVLWQRQVTRGKEKMANLKEERRRDIRREIKERAAVQNQEKRKRIRRESSLKQTW